MDETAFRRLLAFVIFAACDDLKKDRVCGERCKDGAHYCAADALAFLQSPGCMILLEAFGVEVDPERLPQILAELPHKWKVFGEKGREKKHSCYNCNLICKMPSGDLVCRLNGSLPASPGKMRLRAGCELWEGREGKIKKVDDEQRTKSTGTSDMAIIDKGQA